jgi:hypothetical protein
MSHVNHNGNRHVEHIGGWPTHKTSCVPHP